MSRNKRFRKQISSLEACIKEHRQKIEQELTKPEPNWAYIAHWSTEIESWQKQVNKRRSKLPRR